MPFIPVPNTAKVCMRYSQAGQQICNVFHVEAPDPLDVARLNDIAAVFWNWFNTDVKGSVSNALTLEAIEVTDLTTAGGIGIEYTTGLPLSGTLTDGALPNNVTLAVKLTTGMTGRSHRGRSYFPGLTLGSITSDRNHVTSGAQSAIDLAFDALIDNLVTEGVKLVITSLFSGGVPRTTGVNTEVIDASVNATLDSQRRRLPERGA